LRFTETPILGVWVADVDRIEDERGFFGRMWCQREFAEHGLNSEMVQANVGYSKRRGTLRGLHYQAAPHEEAKFIKCTQGAIFDVAVDLRSDSSTFREWFGTELTDRNRTMLYVAEGCAHGYIALTEDAEIFYLTSEFFVPSAARGVRFDDPAFAIEWPIEVEVISEQDGSWPLLEGKSQ
jgi:dTDP-4-dehydrorhamnose 3,5-epimerase